MVQSQPKTKSIGDRWLLETLALVGCFLSLVAMAILLQYFNNRPIFDWYGVTLNAIVSLLSTAYKACLVLAVVESISQWKWILFSRRQQRLIDLDIIDCSSRGPLGSMKLLWRTRGMAYAWIGAVITILALGLDPFAQQLLQLQSRLEYSKPDNLTGIAQARRYSKGNKYFVDNYSRYPGIWRYASAHSDFAMQSAVLYGLAEPIDSVTQQLTFRCPSNNCEWDAFRSLAVCSICNNVTTSLTRRKMGNNSIPEYIFINLEEIPSGNLTEYNLPNGLYINNIDNHKPFIYMTSFGTRNASETISLQTMDLLVWSMTIIKIRESIAEASIWPNLPVEATECALYYCVNEYKPSVRNSILSEKVVQVMNAGRAPGSWKAVYSTEDNGFRFNKSLEVYESSLEFNGSFSSISRTDLMLGNNYNISQTAVDGISSYFQGLLAFNEKFISNVNGFIGSDGSFHYYPVSIVPIYQSSNLTATFHALAVSMSNAIRNGADNSTLIPGRSGRIIAFYVVQWQWIILPCFLLVAGTAFFVLTVLETRKAGIVVWKSSSIAVLSCGLAVADILRDTDYVSEMKQRAEKENVQLLRPNLAIMCNKDESQIPLRSLTQQDDAEEASTHQKQRSLPNESPESVSTASNYQNHERTQTSYRPSHDLSQGSLSATSSYYGLRDRNGSSVTLVRSPSW
ncbi:MAG: hypothetical protein M1834_003631 [Cirrosporium novae-zelandiae]|nr:MAG: hypothetical protein M1834_003631 [Cirrosporium novae-zelandiae]